ncbi:MAG: type II toxin-antitoxin system VapC family toxin [Rhodospirillaceae bacterium]|nr:type II toxin-antitoxin system VapC family toxin [Rhodospirillaceae bacterium]MCY4065807.1 type II toxin-antitoxin system VapC family toxin [Rhodospirillaceae bacterium]
MIAVDTSALMAILGDEPEADACAEALDTDERLLISAATVAEALIVAGRRDLGMDMAELIDRAGLEIVGVSPAAAQRVAGAYAKWGKGVHPAALNFGDCFAYETAKTHDCPLLYVGRDFAQTDVASVL